ncbi:trypsin-like peptidase domain-containing protein [Bradyrhizobium sp. Y36]|uniref:trypsin-like serine peptidase n=1 Tax=Bradyrhizobium sp. Y36 TaxID=2035447 RepID=UPI00130420B2|nr:trypsin-like peptidase domain-containing protein [Bradyrhizobium sp. Y36]
MFVARFSFGVSLLLAVSLSDASWAADAQPEPAQATSEKGTSSECNPPCSQARDGQLATIAAQIKNRERGRDNPIEVDPLQVIFRLKMPPLREVDPLAVAFMPSSADRGFEARRSTAPDAIGATCNVEFDMPFPVERAIRFYQVSEDAKKCSRATRNIRSLVTDVGEDAYRALQSASYINNVDHSLSKSVVEDYVSACTKSFQAPPISKLLGADNILRIRQTVGLIRTPSSMCMGAFVGNKVLTAKHCFATSEADGKLSIDASAATTFKTIDGAEYSLKPVGPGKSVLSDIDRDKDWILLTTTDGAKPKAGGLDFHPESASRWQPLILLGLSRYNMALNDKYQPDDAMASLDISPICSVMARDGGYIYHACQTLEGMSGAPLLTMSGGRIVTVGVHTGDAEKVSTACAKKLSARYPNYGIAPSIKPEELR